MGYIELFSLEKTVGIFRVTSRAARLGRLLVKTFEGGCPD